PRRGTARGLRNRPHVLQRLLAARLLGLWTADVEFEGWHRGSLAPHVREGACPMSLFRPHLGMRRARDARSASSPIVPESSIARRLIPFLLRSRHNSADP